MLATHGHAHRGTCDPSQTGQSFFSSFFFFFHTHAHTPNLRSFCLHSEVYKPPHMSLDMKPCMDRAAPKCVIENNAKCKGKKKLKVSSSLAGKIGITRYKEFYSG